MRQTQGRQDVEVSAQLISKDDEQRDGQHDSHDHNHGSRENFDVDYDDANDAYSYWPNQYQSSSRQIWQRVQSLPLPGWLPVRKLNQLNPRYLVFAVIISLVITVLIVNPYGLSRPSEALGSTTAASADIAEAKDSSPFGHAPFKHNDQFCTTWPVDEHGNYDLDAQDRSNRAKSHSIAPPGGWQKPVGVKIIAMVFFGRKRYVDILDCYLQRNLASNGGYLDEVWFMAHTEVEEDLEWLNGHVAKNQYYRIVGEKDCKANDKKYGCLWKFATGDNTIYVKLDDDIVSHLHSFRLGAAIRHTELAASSWRRRANSGLLDLYSRRRHSSTCAYTTCCATCFCSLGSSSQQPYHRHGAIPPQCDLSFRAGS